MSTMKITFETPSSSKKEDKKTKKVSSNNEESSSSDDKGVWTPSLEKKYMESMMSFDPIHAEHGTKTGNWILVMEAVNKFAKENKLNGFGLQSIKLHYKKLFEEFERRDKKGSNGSGGNEDYTELDQAIANYKNYCDGKSNDAKRKRDEKDEEKKKKQATREVLLERQKSIAQVSSCSSNKKGKSKKGKEKAVAANDAEENSTEDSAITSYLDGSADCFSDNHEIQSIREEMYRFLDDNEKEANELNRQMTSDMKSFKDTQIIVEKRLQALEAGQMELKQMLTFIIENLPKRQSYHPVLPASK